MAAPADEVDVVVVGTGGGGLLAAVRAHDLGLSVQLIEKTNLVGGTTALSGGGLWVPCNFSQKESGVSDDLRDAFTYVRTCARGLASDDRVLAYVETASKMAAYVHGLGVKYRCVPLYSDYYPTLPGARPGGRTMDPIAFDASRLGLDGLAELRPSSQLILGRMSIDAFDAHTILDKTRGWFLTFLKVVVRYWLDLPWRFKTRHDRRMTGGQALAGGLFWAARERRVPIATRTRLVDLVVEDGRVGGVVVETPAGRRTIKAKRGVVLAAGGFERNQAMREKYLPKPTSFEWTATPAEANTGDAILAAERVGAQLHLMAHTWGAPTMRIPGLDRYLPIFVERSMPGCMVVNRQGKRFLDESGPYPEFQQAMFADNDAGGGAVPAWIVFDAAFRKKYPMGPLMPASMMPDDRVPRRYWDKVVWKGETWEALGAKIGVDPAGLAASAARMTEFARSGVDDDFGRGGNVFDRYYGDVNVKPCPNLAPIGTAPFYAMQIWPGDIGTKGGPLTDRDARVLDAAGAVIPGLYCIGNNSASVMGPAYPGAGSTLGPALTFGYRAAADLAGQSLPIEHPDWLGTPAAA